MDGAGLTARTIPADALWPERPDGGAKHVELSAVLQGQQTPLRATDSNRASLSWGNESRPSRPHYRSATRASMARGRSLPSLNRLALRRCDPERAGCGDVFASRQMSRRFVSQPYAHASDTPSSPYGERPTRSIAANVGLVLGDEDLEGCLGIGVAGVHGRPADVASHLPVAVLT